MITNQNRVSIVIPAFNAGGTIASVLSAVFKQECNELEVVVVDDSSSDNTAKLAAAFPVKAISCRKRSGAGAARNLGVKETSGDIIVFLDADVELKSGALKSILREYKDTGTAAVLGNYSNDTEGLNFASAYKQLYIHQTYASYSGQLNNQFWTAFGSVRREAFDAVGGFTDSFVGAGYEDIDLGIRLTEKGFNIKYADGAFGKHLRRYTLLSLIKNDFRKGREDVYIHILNKARLTSNRHAGINHIISAGLAVVCLLSLLAGFFLKIAWIAAMAGGLFFILLRRELLRIMIEKGLWFGIVSLGLTLILYSVRVLCVPAGIIGALFQGLKKQTDIPDQRVSSESRNIEAAIE